MRWAWWSSEHGYQSTLFWGSLGVSFLLFIATLIALPVWVVRLPADYFQVARPRTHGWKKWARSVSATVLIIVGIAMLVLPGQGVLTILFGLSLLDVPWKNRMEKRLLLLPSVFGTMNKIRRRAGAVPLNRPSSPAIRE